MARPLRTGGPFSCAHYFERYLTRTASVSRLPEANIKTKTSKNSRCPYTGIKLIPGVNASLDHIVPKCNGGSDELSNLQWVHIWINKMKFCSDEDEFVRKLDEFLRDATNYRKLTLVGEQH